ncbi:hypothetical protein LWM68_42345 [Niabella sp. W65]|nr:hypothetical protein [Niabella sp. W65]MCH7368791.1 hypothetical protein [Niabella sp. W65]ULT44368.1 hypothetical protein KRR40_14050 [Niabella sp. I65]
MNPTIYQEKATLFHKKFNELKQKLGWLSFIRLLCFLLFVYLIYLYSQTGSGFTLLTAVLLFAAFLLLVRWYGRVQQEKQFYLALAQWNEREDVFYKLIARGMIPAKNTKTRIILTRTTWIFLVKEVYFLT